MFMSALILILSIGFFCFYLQGICQKILRREFAQQFSNMIVKANSMEFPSVRMALERSSAPVGYPQLMATLRCDFLALTYLLKNAANVNQCHSNQERFLIVYFKFLCLSLVTRHWLKLQERPAALKLTAILEHFANVVGERVDRVRFGNLTAFDYLSNL